MKSLRQQVAASIGKSLLNTIIDNDPNKDPEIKEYEKEILKVADKVIKIVRKDIQRMTDMKSRAERLVSYACTYCLQKNEVDTDHLKGSWFLSRNTESPDNPYLYAYNSYVIEFNCKHCGESFIIPIYMPEPASICHPEHAYQADSITFLTERGMPIHKIPKYVKSRYDWVNDIDRMLHCILTNYPVSTSLVSTKEDQKVYEWLKRVVKERGRMIWPRGKDK